MFNIVNIVNEVKKTFQNLFEGVGKQVSKMLENVGPAVIAEYAVESAIGKKGVSATPAPSLSKGPSIATGIADAIGIGSDITGLRKKLLYIVQMKLDVKVIKEFDKKYDLYRKDGKENKFVTVLSEAIGASNETIPDDDKIAYLEEICRMDDERFDRWLNASDHDPLAEKAKYAIKEANKVLEEGAEMFRKMRSGSHNAQKPGLFSRIGKRMKEAA